MKAIFICLTVRPNIVARALDDAEVPRVGEKVVLSDGREYSVDEVIHNIGSGEVHVVVG